MIGLRLRVMLTLLIVFSISSCGFTTGGLRHQPGYATMFFPHWWQAEQEVSISFGPTVLNWAHWASKYNNPELSAILNKLDGVRIKVYNTHGNNGPLLKYISKTKKRLDLQGWEKVATVKDGDSQVEVMAFSQGEKVMGMVVMVIDDNDIVFINIIGSITPETLDAVVHHVYEDAPRVAAHSS